MHRRAGVIAVNAVLVICLAALGGCATSTSGTSGTSGTEGLALPGSDSATAVRGDARPSLEGYESVAEVKDVHFDFDKYSLRSDAVAILDKSAEWLKAHPSYALLIEGHCDERGTNEYNLALGERRARASMNYLVSHGVQSSRITVISYGEERPLCSEKTERCWAANRRAHFGVKAQ